MKYIQICRSQKFEKLVIDHCQQFGSLALITTSDPTSTELRLNEGWCYWGGPRNGTKSPPLAYFSDWKVVATWSVDLDADIYGLLRAINNMFDRPCIIRQIEDRLMKDDNVLFPNLGAKGMSKNGLDNVFCLSRLSYPSRNQINCDTDVQYQDYITQIIVSYIEMLIDATDIEVLDEIDLIREDEKEVRSE